jgi:hypothetical protein
MTATVIPFVSCGLARAVASARDTVESSRSDALRFATAAGRVVRRPTEVGGDEFGRVTLIWRTADAEVTLIFLGGGRVEWRACRHLVCWNGSALTGDVVDHVDFAGATCHRMPPA